MKINRCKFLLTMFGNLRIHITQDFSTGPTYIMCSSEFKNNTLNLFTSMDNNLVTASILLNYLNSLDYQDSCEIRVENLFLRSIRTHKNDDYTLCKFELD